MVDEFRAGSACRAGRRVLASGRVAAAPGGAWAVSLGAPPDDVIVVRVAGEVDRFTGAVLRAALADSLARGPV
jgi:hypothetical protein